MALPRRSVYGDSACLLQGRLRIEENVSTQLYLAFDLLLFDGREHSHLVTGIRPALGKLGCLARLSVNQSLLIGRWVTQRREQCHRSVTDDSGGPCSIMEVAQDRT